MCRSNHWTYCCVNVLLPEYKCEWQFFGLVTVPILNLHFRRGNIRVPGRGAIVHKPEVAAFKLVLNVECKAPRSYGEAGKGQCNSGKGKRGCVRLIWLHNGSSSDMRVTCSLSHSSAIISQTVQTMTRIFQVNTLFYHIVLHIYSTLRSLETPHYILT